MSSELALVLSQVWLASMDCTRAARLVMVFFWLIYAFARYWFIGQ